MSYAPEFEKNPAQKASMEKKRLQSVYRTYRETASLSICRRAAKRLVSLLAG
jgi:hypothetical protein